MCLEIVLFFYYQFMEQAKRIIKLITKEETENDKKRFIPHVDTSTIEYIEDGEQKQSFK